MGSALSVSGAIHYVRYTHESIIERVTAIVDVVGQGLGLATMRVEGEGKAIRLHIYTSEDARGCSPTDTCPVLVAHAHLGAVGRESLVIYGTRSDSALV